MISDDFSYEVSGFCSNCNQRKEWVRHSEYRRALLHQLDSQAKVFMVPSKQ